MSSCSWSAPLCSPRPCWSLLGSAPHMPRRRHVSHPAPLTHRGAGVGPTPRPSLWHSSDTNGWGVSSLCFVPSDSTASSWSRDLVGAADHWKPEVLFCLFIFVVVKLRLWRPLSSLSVVSCHFAPRYSLTPSSSPNWINRLISSSFCTYIFSDIKRNGIWLCCKWFVLFVAKDYEQTVKHFFLSEITEKLMQNKLTNETLLASKYLTLSLEKEMQPGGCWKSLFSVLKKMIVLSRQTWKEGEYFVFLIFLGTNNLFGKWCLF